MVLLTFFISSTLISRLSPNRGSETLGAKGERRDQWQVLANGGAAAAGALLDPFWPGAGLFVVTTSLAAAAADTWATSGGARSRRPPRHILTWQSVPGGTSGGITPAGCVSAAMGAGLVALSGALAAQRPLLLPAGLLIGFLGMLADSFIGAAWQGRFQCPSCLQFTERRVHRCGTVAVPRGGFPWLTNDGVNAAASTLAALAGLSVWWLLR
jgi:uncharacterized protein (TIGR00297 family)